MGTSCTTIGACGAFSIILKFGDDSHDLGARERYKDGVMIFEQCICAVLATFQSWFSGTQTLMASTIHTKCKCSIPGMLLEEEYTFMDRSNLTHTCHLRGLVANTFNFAFTL